MSFYICIPLTLVVLLVSGFDISVVKNGPFIIGGTINFLAEINGTNASQFRYSWKDTKLHQNKTTFVSELPTYEWNITYPKEKDQIGEHIVELEVCSYNLTSYWPCKSHQTSFNITDKLSGELELIRNYTIENSTSVLNHTEVVYNISLISAEETFLEENNFTKVAYWFLNCSYHGMTYDLKFRHIYNNSAEVDSTTIKAVVVAAKLNETSNLTEAFTDNPFLEGSWKNKNSSSIRSPWPDDSCNDTFILPEDHNKYYGYFYLSYIPKVAAKNHPELSVIIIPIGLSALALIVIIFGIVYYIQRKKRYTIEVANFDFSAADNNDYKSFRERLRDVVSCAFPRSAEEGEEDSSWSPSRKPISKPERFENSDSESQDTN